MDLKEELKFTQIFDPAVPSVGANASDIIGTGGGQTCFLYNYGSWTSTAASFTVEVQHGDTATTGAMAAVADTDLSGTEAAAGVAAASPVDDDRTGEVGYIGGKPFVRTVVTHVGGAGATGVLGITAVQRVRKGPAA